MSSYLQIQSLPRNSCVCSWFDYYVDNKRWRAKLLRRDTIWVQKIEQSGRSSVRRRRRRDFHCNGSLFPVDPWAPNVDSQSIASQLFAVSLFPYLGFLYFITKSKTAPKLTLFGFYFLLTFVGATIPAGIYGLRGALRKPKEGSENTSAEATKEEKPLI